MLHFKSVCKVLATCVLASGCLDDYPIVEMSQLCINTENAMTAVVNLLGVRISEDKDQGFNRSAEMFGVCLDVSSEDLSAVKVGNRED